MHSNFFKASTCILFVYGLISTPSHAQGLAFSLSSGSASRGGSTTLNLSLSGTTSGQPASLEWTVTYSPTDFSSAAVAVASAAVQASKSVSCESQTGSVTCILWGFSSSTIPNGVVATVSLDVSTSTLSTSSPVQISGPAAANASATSLSASATGGTVSITQTPGLNGFSCSPASITPPNVSTCTVGLTSPAGSGGATIDLSSSPADVNLASTVTIPTGATSAGLTLTAETVTSPTPVTITASYAGVSETFGLTVNPPPAALNSISISPATIVGGQSATGTVTLTSAAGSGGAVVALSSSNSAMAQVPASVTVPAGATSATFSMTTATVTSSTSVTLTASYASLSMTADVVVNPVAATLSSLSISPATIVGGQSATGTVTLTSAAGSGGAVVALSSSNSAMAQVPASVTVPLGATSATFSVATSIVTTPAAVTLTAGYADASTTAGLIVTSNSTAPNPIGKDATVFVDGQNKMTTPTFSTTQPGDLLVAFVGYDGPASSPQTARVTGAGLAWTLLTRSNSQAGTSEIWASQSPNLLSGVTVSSVPGTTGFHGSLTVIAFTNASGTGMVNAASAPSGAPDVVLSDASAGSWVFAVGHDWDNAIARVPVTGQVLVHQRIDTQTGDTYWVQSTAAPAIVSGLVDIHDTSPTTDRWTFAAVEIVATHQ